MYPYKLELRLMSEVKGLEKFSEKEALEQVQLMQMIEIE